MRELLPDLLNQDFVDFLRCIYEHDVASILVGGYAVVLHGYFRTTGDLVSVGSAKAAEFREYKLMPPVLLIIFDLNLFKNGTFRYHSLS